LLVCRRRQLMVVTVRQLAVSGHLGCVRGGHLRVICGGTSAALTTHGLLHGMHDGGLGHVASLTSRG
jgi:hypothetical protein